MEEDIKFWRGQRLVDMSADDLRAALAELYREHEQLKWKHYKATGGTGEKTGMADRLRGKRAPAATNDLDKVSEAA
jgi:hypothetical protein